MKNKKRNKQQKARKKAPSDDSRQRIASLQRMQSSLSFFATEHGRLYKNKLESYSNLLKIIFKMSLNQHGIDTSGRGLRAMRIFTRLTCLAASLLDVLPLSNNGSRHSNSFCDLIAVASISRGLIECFHYLIYFGVEEITEDEASLRYLIYQRHNNAEKYHCFWKMNSNTEESEEKFQESQQISNGHISSNQFYLSLDSSKQKSLLKLKKEIYKTMYEYGKEYVHLSRMPEDYRLLSNFTHPLGISIERIDNINGRGLLSPSDTTWLCLFIEIAERYISMSAKEIADFFSERFAPLLGKETEVLKSYYENQPESEAEQV